MSISLGKTDRLTAEEYLAGERIATEKHELMDGHAYAMSGASKNHNRISMNISTEFRPHLKGSQCEVFNSDMKVRVGDNFFYPDVMVLCDDNEDDYYTSSPTILVEVLSKSTRSKDQTYKLERYLTIPSLKEYVIIEQDIAEVRVLAHNANWVVKHYYLGDVITFDSIGLTLSVEDIYDRVINGDVQKYLMDKARN